MKIMVLDKDKVNTVGRDNAIRALLHNLRLELADMVGDVRGNKCLVVSAEIKTQASVKKDMPNEPKPKSTENKSDESSEGKSKSSSDSAKSDNKKDGKSKKVDDTGKSSSGKNAGDEDGEEIKDPLENMSPEK